MSRLGLLALPLAVLWLLGCGAGDPAAVSVGTDRSDESAPTVPPPDADRLYEASAIVLEADDGPQLCLGGVALSLPPQCGDVPIAGWDWEAVEGEESSAGTTWGEFHVVGLYDGETFTVTEVGRFEDDELGTDTADFSSPCPEPTGGWVVPEPVLATQEHADAASAYATSQPDYVTSWVTHLEKAQAEFGPVVFNAAFTGAVADHETALRKIWEGPLCVVRREGPTANDLARIRKEVEADLVGLGLTMLWSHGPSVEPTVEIGVVADRYGAAQAAFDERYGPGVVRVVPALRPVD